MKLLSILKVRKRVLILFLVAIFVNGYALNTAIAAKKANAATKTSSVACNKCCDCKASSCQNSCHWLNIFCKLNCAVAANECITGCIASGEPNVQCPVACSES